MNVIEAVGSEATKAFEGTLSVLPVPELLQFIHISGKDGVLVISDDEGRPRAVVYYVQSDIIHATCDGIAGRDAIYAAIAHTSGRFEFFAGNVTRPIRTIDEGVQNLILEGLRRADELSHVTSLLPADDHPLYLAPDPPGDEIRLTAREWRILQLVNGKRTLRQIIDASQRAEPEVRAALVALLTADLIIDRRDDAYLDAIVPRMLRQDEVGATRYAPPTLLANLLVKACNGKRTARELMSELQLEERALFEELKLLVRTSWLAFAGGEEIYRRICEE